MFRHCGYLLLHYDDLLKNPQNGNGHPGQATFSFGSNRGLYGSYNKIIRPEASQQSV